MPGSAIISCPDGGVNGGNGSMAETGRGSPGTHLRRAVIECVLSAMKSSTAESSTAGRQQTFRASLLAWYDAHARALPWRETHDPYRVWLSEIMLQQTRVAAVIAHYHEFLRRFPNVEKLVRAREDSVLAAWSGLGYYRRARMLHTAAKGVVRELSGKVPETVEGVR